MEEVNKAIVEKKMKKKVNDKVVIISIVVAVLLVAAALVGVFYYKNNVQAVVEFDGGKVTKAEFTVYYKTFAQILEYYGYPASAIPEQIANKAAIDKIIVGLAKEAGLTISDEDKKKVDELFSDSERLQNYSENGIDIAIAKQVYYDDYLINDYIEKLEAEVTEEETLAYIKNLYGEDADYNQYNTRHILFKTTKVQEDGSTKEMTAEEKAVIKQKAEAVLVRAKNGEDFAALAKEFSEDGTKEQGGVFELYVDENVYNIYKEYTAAAKALKAGEIYPTLVETGAGYHIIKLDSIVENGRAKSPTEKSIYVDDKINSLSKEKNVKIDKTRLFKLVEDITGVKQEIPKDNDNNQTDDKNNNDTTGDGTSTENDNNK